MVVINTFECPLWIILVVYCLVFMYRYATQPGTIWKDLGVPSPPSVPFIGHMHRIYNPKTGFRGSIADWTRQHGKIFGILFFREPMLVVTDVDAAKEVLVKDFANYSSRYGGADGLYQTVIQKSILLNGGSSWKRVRHIMSPSFSSGKLRLLTNHINGNALKLVEALNKHIEHGTLPEAKVVFSAYSLDVLAGAAFGLEFDSQNNLNGSFYQHAKSLVTFSKSVQLVIATLGAFPCLGGVFKMLDIGFFNSSDIRYFKKQFSRLISERSQTEQADSSTSTSTKHVDFLQFLMNGEHFSPEQASATSVRVSQKMTVEEIVAQSIIFVIAGYETTSATLQWLTYELSKHGDVQTRLREEIDDVIGDAKGDVTYEQCKKLKYMEAVIHETLRMYPPVVTLSRKSQNDTKLKGFSVPAGAAVIIPVYNICRDPEVFQDPDTFNPARFMTDKLRSPTSDFLTSLPFGFGPRQCLGFQLAILQVKIALVHVVRSVRVDGATPRNVEMDDFTALLLPKQPIRLNLSRRVCV